VCATTLRWSGVGLIERRRTFINYNHLSLLVAFALVPRIREVLPSAPPAAIDWRVRFVAAYSAISSDSISSVSAIAFRNCSSYGYSGRGQGLNCTAMTLSTV
jgi:hypothetical protein